MSISKVDRGILHNSAFHILYGKCYSVLTIGINLCVISIEIECSLSSFLRLVSHAIKPSSANIKK